MTTLLTLLTLLSTSIINIDTVLVVQSPFVSLLGVHVRIGVIMRHAT